VREGARYSARRGGGSVEAGRGDVGAVRDVGGEREESVPGITAAVASHVAAAKKKKQEGELELKREGENNTRERMKNCPFELLLQLGRSDRNQDPMSV
jgi:hypothetical protein